MNETNPNHKATIGILAYGSLISDPGVEIKPLIVERIPTQTPFPVEYARLSRGRGDAPTVVPHTSGNPVRAEILILAQGVSLPEAEDLLWRRETRKEGTGERYRAGSSPNSVLVVDASGFHGLGHVLYTDFPLSGKIAAPDPSLLARAAVTSVAKAPLGNDGISYMIQLSESGIETALTAKFRGEVLRITGAASLREALGWLQGARVSDKLREQLWARAGAGLSASGYFPRLEDNLLPGVCRLDFEADFRAGSGYELDGKIRAAHSSSCLAVNTFAPFRARVTELKILECDGFERLCFEKRLPTGLGGTPPNIDVWLENGRVVLAIESKLLEYFKPTIARFVESYCRKSLPWAEDCWWAVLEDAKHRPKRHLDVAQLVKHYLGLVRHVRENQGVSGILLYLFWEPINAETLAVCRQHRAEIERLAKQVKDSAVTFRWMSYPQLWKDWGRFPNLADHVDQLKKRYEICI